MNTAQRMRLNRRIDSLLSIMVSLIIIIFCLIPLVWIFATSIKPRGTEFLLPMQFWPSNPTLQAYTRVLVDLQFMRPIMNSFIVSSCVTIMGLFLASLSAYAIARLRIRYKIQALFLLQIGGMIPPVITIAPTFIMIRSLGLLGTLPGLMLPHIFYNIPISSWLLSTYFSDIPYSLDDSALIDGCTHFQTFRKIILPLAAPGLFCAGIFAFIGSYGEFMLASTITMGQKAVQTVPVAILNFSVEFRLQWTWISAGIILAVLPIILLVVIFQRKVISGLTAGAVKG